MSNGKNCKGFTIEKNETESNENLEEESITDNQTNSSTLRFLENVIDLNNTENFTLAETTNSSLLSLEIDYFIVLPDWFVPNDTTYSKIQ